MAKGETHGRPPIRALAPAWVAEALVPHNSIRRITPSKDNLTYRPRGTYGNSPRLVLPTCLCSCMQPVVLHMTPGARAFGTLPDIFGSCLPLSHQAHPLIR